jgi:hypothetical protein
MGMIVCNTAQENVMNARGSCYYMVWLINLKDNNNQYYPDKPFERCFKRQYYSTRWEIKNNIYIHYPVAADPGLGCSRSIRCALSRSISLESCKKTEFPVTWLGGGGECPGWRGAGLCSTWFHMGQAGQSSTVHQLLLHGTLSTLHTWWICQDCLHPNFLLLGTMIILLSHPLLP